MGAKSTVLDPSDNQSLDDISEQFSESNDMIEKAVTDAITKWRKKV
jgi:hypothetical protein